MTYAVSTDCLVLARLVILRVTINRGPPTSKELCPQDLKSTSSIFLSNSSFDEFVEAWQSVHGSTRHLVIYGQIVLLLDMSRAGYWSVRLKRNMILSLRKRLHLRHIVGSELQIDEFCLAEHANIFCLAGDAHLTRNKYWWCILYASWQDQFSSPITSLGRHWLRKQGSERLVCLLTVCLVWTYHIRRC